MSMNPRTTTEKIRRDYQEYLSSILTVHDPKITELGYKEVKRSEFVKGPYLEATLPFQEGKKLSDLVQEDLISAEFEKLGKAVHYDEWHLRVHQEQALRHIITEKRNMVVSTGTGSGKTECYLYPILNALMREKEEGTLGDGVRALLLFPMNALANDQQKKLRKMLRDYPDITFGRYTGETPHLNEKVQESAQEAEDRLHDEYDVEHRDNSDEALRKSIPNERMCREMMVEHPPHILLTNYAMLEYMLLRPDTAPFFDGVASRHWKYIVIDEAHTYKGATGTEIAFLLRRVKARICQNTKRPFTCIATSATLGSEDGKKDLAQFANDLFDEPFDECDIITTKRVQRKQPKQAVALMPVDYVQLKERTQDLEENEKARMLWGSLSVDSRIYSLYDVLKSRPKKIEEVADRVFADINSADERIAALVDLIELAAAAKKAENESALLPARYHLFIKSLEGMFVQYYPYKHVYLDRKEMVLENGGSCSVFEMANCQHCGQEYIVGKQQTENGKVFLRQTGSEEKPDYYFVSDQAQSELTEMDEDDSVEEPEKNHNLNKYHFCLACGKLTPFAEKCTTDCCSVNDDRKIVQVYQLRYGGKTKESNCCPCCGTTRHGLIKRFLTANQTATFAIAKSLYDAIPPRPKTKEEKEARPQDAGSLEWDWFEDDDFQSENVEDEVADERGRKLLIFSDNRQEAAFFAGFLDKKYALIMWRKAILRCIKHAPEQCINMNDLIDAVTDYATRNRLYDAFEDPDNSLIHKKKIAAQYVMQEFLHPDWQTGLEGLGFIQVFPASVQTIRDRAELCGVQGEDLRGLIRFMLDTLRMKGTVSYPDGIHAEDEFFEPRNKSCYFRESGSSSGSSFIYGFVPASGSRNRRLSLAQKIVQNTSGNREDQDASARKILCSIYLNLLTNSKFNAAEKRTIDREGIVYQLRYKDWRFKYVNSEDTLYKCKKCGRIFAYSVAGLCPEMKCDGRLSEVRADAVQNIPYYSALYADDKLIPMVAKEHTAQLTGETAREYQEQFEEGKINVLSCSTTFEMGVDVGELEATLLRNVPPETSNYIQRAGRAGRRTSSAAFSVTFARRNSHDLTYYQDPVHIIAGKIHAPVLEVNNERIARRHLHSIVISWFLKRERAYFDENTRKIVYDDMSLALSNALNKHPQDLLDQIHAALPPEMIEQLNVDAWGFISYLTGKDGSLTMAIAERKSDLDNLRSIHGNSIKDHYRAIAAQKLIETLEQEKTISFLSSKGVLPKYGFPIDTVALDVISGNSEDAKRIELARDLRVAISEFAPPSQVVANGRVWASYALNTMPSKSWPTYVYYVCPSCKKIQPPTMGMVDVSYDLNQAETKRCICGKWMTAKKFVIPIFGFSTELGDNPKSVGDTKPSAFYATQTQFWNDNDLTEIQKKQRMEEPYTIKGKQITRVYSPGGKLFVVNQGKGERGFRICPTCGFATDPMLLPRKVKQMHRTKFDRPCSSHTQPLSLGHVFSTDVLRITLPQIPKEYALTDYNDKDLYLSVLYALLEGASIELGISRDDINGCLDANGDIILYDDTPGGSGFVKRVYIHLDGVFRAAKNKVSGRCGCTEETSCYGCLRTYSNQYFHDRLSRGLALQYLIWLMDSDAVIPMHAPKKSEPEERERVGSRRLDFALTEPQLFGDSATVLQYLYETSDDNTEKTALLKLLPFAQNKRYEQPMMDTPLPADQDLWPEVFWPKSKVALFAPGNEAQCALLRQYDWHCFILNDMIEPKQVFDLIVREGE